MYDDDGIQVDEQIANLKLIYHRKQVVQAFNMIIEERQYEILREMKFQMIKSQAEHSRSLMQPSSPDSANKIYGFNSRNFNKSTMDNQRASLDMPNLDNSFLTNVKVQDISLNSVRGGNRRTRKNKLNSIKKNCATLTNNSQLAQKVQKEVYKLEKTKLIMKNVIKNQIIADKKAFDIERKLKEKEHKYNLFLKEQKLKKQVKEERKNVKNKEKQEQIKQKQVLENKEHAKKERDLVRKLKGIESKVIESQKAKIDKLNQWIMKHSERENKVKQYLNISDSQPYLPLEDD